MHDLGARVDDLMAEAMVLVERGGTGDLAMLELLQRELEHVLDRCETKAVVADVGELLTQIVGAVQFDRTVPPRLALAS